MMMSEVNAVSPPLFDFVHVSISWVSQIETTETSNVQKMDCANDRQLDWISRMRPTLTTAPLGLLVSNNSNFNCRVRLMMMSVRSKCCVVSSFDFVHVSTPQPLKLEQQWLQMNSRRWIVQTTERVIVKFSLFLSYLHLEDDKKASRL